MNQRAQTGTTAGPGRPSGAARLILPALVALAAIAVYANTAGYGFVFDERILITNNPAVKDLTRLDLIFGQKFWPGRMQGVYYRPIVTLSYAVGCAVAGQAPWIQHLINVLCHAAVSVLVYFLALRLSKKTAVAMVTGLLFAVHPIHVESVAWVPGRTDVISILFMLAAWLFLLRSRERSWLIHLAASLISFALALGAKEVAIVLPALVIVNDALTEGRESLRRKWEYAAMIALALAFMLVRLRVLQGPGTPPPPDPLAALTPFQRINAVVAVFGLAAKQMVLPWRWTIDYAYARSFLPAPAWASLVAVALAVAAVIARRSRLMVFCIVGFFISMLPVSHVIPFPTFFAERFLYLPSLFACILIALGVTSVLDGLHDKRGIRTAATALCCGLFLAVSGLCVIRGLDFKDDLTFWSAAVRQDPELAVARNWLGIAFRDRGMYGKAEEQYNAALALDPSFTVARMNRAEIFMKTGRTDEAVAELSAMEKDDPDNPDLLLNLGMALMTDGDWKDASEKWEKALALDPQNANAAAMLAAYYARVVKDRDKARRYLDLARKLQPDHPLVKKLERELGD